MPVDLLIGDNGANALQGGSGQDLIYGFNPNGPQAQADAIVVERIASGLAVPLYVVAPPNDPDRLFIVEQGGTVRVLDLASGQILPTPFLDVSGEIGTGSEMGLLGLAFHPDYASNGQFYVNLTNPDGDSEIRRYQVSKSDTNRADATSASLVLRLDQPDDRTNHRAGWIGFGPDGHLYIPFGDGGGGGDPDNLAQNINVFQGKILRLDVDGDDFPGDSTRNYAIPDDNPFVGAAGADEIWALGLRNPWRDSFDRGLGDFFVADVGQSAWEEINLGLSGSNYGWRVYEGPDDFIPGTLGGGTLRDPIHFYDHSVGISVIGGYVYRGSAEALHGRYFFSDLSGGFIATLHFDGSDWIRVDQTGKLVGDASLIDTPTSFGEDALGNLYLTDFDGDVFRLTPIVASADQSDELRGHGGNDMLFGGSGDDVLRGGDDDDTLQGGEGADVLAGDAGADLMAGGAGNDTYFVDNSGDVVVEDADEGRDIVFASISYTLRRNVEELTLLAGATDGVGNELDNILIGNAADNDLDGSAGTDTARYFGVSSDYVWSLNGNGTWTVEDFRTGSPDGIDTLFRIERILFADGAVDLPASLQSQFLGGVGNDTMVGNAAANEMIGLGGDDDVFGLAGNDDLRGNDGDDNLHGGAGDDLMVGGAGADILTGGAGRDEAAYQSSGAAVDVDLIRGTGRGGEAQDDLFGSVENLVGSAFDDTIVGDNADNWLFGLAGNDRLWGESGDDILNGGAGADILTGGAGLDSTSYANADTGVRVVLFQGIGRNGDAEGDLFGSIEEVIGSQHQDELFGDNADNRLFGLGDHDAIEGGGGNDLLEGGDGSDKLFGQDGDDTLIGGAGQDRLFGGGGADVFVFTTVSDSVAGAEDEVVEFTRQHGDRIDVSRIDANIAASGDQAFAFIGSNAFDGTAGQLRYDGRFLEGDVDGNGTADIRVQFNIDSLLTSDFLL